MRSLKRKEDNLPVFHRRVSGCSCAYRREPSAENKTLGVSPVKRVKVICTNAYKRRVKLTIKCSHWGLHAVTLKWHTLPQVDSCVIMKLHLRTSDLRIRLFPHAGEHGSIAMAEMIVLKQAAQHQTLFRCARRRHRVISTLWASCGTEFCVVIARSLLVPYAENVNLVLIVYVKLH